ncbi:MAG: hypothetical protein ABI205_04295 [Gemmatimonadaceae bacterium]
MQRQTLEVYLRPTRGAPGVRPPADTILRRMHALGATPLSLYSWIIANADSLLLTRQQLVAFQTAQMELRLRSDSTDRALANELANLPADYKPDVVIARMSEARGLVFNNSRNGSNALIGRLLTKIQYQLIPVFMRFGIPVPAR